MKAFIKNYKIVLFAIVLAVVVLIFSTYKDYGKTWDENDSVALGNHALTYYTSFGKNTSYFSFYPQPEFYLTRGPAIEMLRAAVANSVHNYSSELYHLILALLALSGIIFLYLTTYALTKKISLSVASTPKNP